MKYSLREMLDDGKPVWMLFDGDEEIHTFSDFDVAIEYITEAGITDYDIFPAELSSLIE